MNFGALVGGGVGGAACGALSMYGTAWKKGFYEGRRSALRGPAQLDVSSAHVASAAEITANIEAAVASLRRRRGPLCADCLCRHPYRQHTAGVLPPQAAGRGIW